MNNYYEVGFKDVYPWVWSVMLGVSITLAERRSAFLATGTKSSSQFWIKNLTALILNVALPAVFFGFTLTRLGPLYPQNLSFWQILGVLYLAGAPLGALHLWQFVALKFRWISWQKRECRTVGIAPMGSLLWAIMVFAIPALAAVIRWRIPF